MSGSCPTDTQSSLSKAAPTSGSRINCTACRRDCRCQTHVARPRWKKHVFSPLKSCLHHPCHELKQWRLSTFWRPLRTGCCPAPDSAPGPSWHPKGPDAVATTLAAAGVIRDVNARPRTRTHVQLMCVRVRVWGGGGVGGEGPEGGVHK